MKDETLDDSVMVTYSTGCIVSALSLACELDMSRCQLSFFTSAIGEFITH